MLNFKVFGNIVKNFDFSGKEASVKTLFWRQNLSVFVNF
jgi:hypothetical protein